MAQRQVYRESLLSNAGANQSRIMVKSGVTEEGGKSPTADGSDDMLNKVENVETWQTHFLLWARGVTKDDDDIIIIAKGLDFLFPPLRRRGWCHYFVVKISNSANGILLRSSHEQKKK